jgi:3-oxoacyl-[acyl-carrier-protein] synthase II
MSGRQVVITGLGVVSPVGNDKKEFFSSLINGISGIGRISLFDPSGYPSQIAGEVKNWQPLNFFDKRQARRLDRFTQFALVAARQAVEDADLNIGSHNSKEVGVIIGSGIGGLTTLEQQHKILLEKGSKRVSPFLIPMMIADLAAGEVAIYFGAKGPNFACVSACASSTHAIGEAYETIKRGAAEVIIAGGSEAPITPLSVAGFSSAKALSTRNDQPEKASRPFDASRDGFVIAEGAGILVLEELSYAVKRRARIYSEIVGYGATDDAYHITAPDSSGEGAASAMRIALNDLSLSDVGYINAHGTSTQANDKLETLAIKKVFGSQAKQLLISSTKSMTGHLLGATGAIEVIATVLAMRNKVIPPTINLDNPDPECDLNYVPNQAVKTGIDISLSNSFAFGGHNACLAIKNCKAS